MRVMGYSAARNAKREASAFALFCAFSRPNVRSESSGSYGGSAGTPPYRPCLGKRVNGNEATARGLPNLYILGIPGSVGRAIHENGASGSIVAQGFFQDHVRPARDYITCKNKAIQQLLDPFAVPYTVWKDLAKKLDGVALAICEPHLFASGKALAVKERGLKLVWSNEMMWPFKGEAEAAREGLVDRVLFVSEFQANAFAEMYKGVPSYFTGNYIDADDYAWRERRNPVFTLGRLSRADPKKYPLDFPVFY